MRTMRTFFQELLRKNKVVIVDINTCVLPEDEASLTHTKYHIHKLIDSASTKFRSYIRAHFTVIMPTIVSDPETQIYFNPIIGNVQYMCTLAIVVPPLNSINYFHSEIIISR